MEKITLENGLELEIDLDLLDDWDFFELLRQIDKGDTGAIVDVIPTALGNEQFNKVKDYLKNEHGRVRASDMVTIFYEVFEKMQKLKNS